MTSVNCEGHLGYFKAVSIAKSANKLHTSYTQSFYTLWVKKLGHFFTAYNFRNIEQIFTKFGMNQSLFILNIVPEFI